MSIRNVPALGATALLVAGLAACGSSSHAAPTPVTVYDVYADPGQNLPATNSRHRAVLTTAVETHQPDERALRYWATGLQKSYLEGALARALRARMGALRR